VRLDRRLLNALVLGAGPLASDVALDAEGAWHVVQLLGHVLAHAFHLAPTRASGGRGFVADLAARRVRRQMQALGLLLLGGGRCLRLCQRGDLACHGRHVRFNLVFEQALLLGAESFGLGRELHALEQRVLVGELVEGGCSKASSWSLAAAASSMDSRAERSCSALRLSSDCGSTTMGVTVPVPATLRPWRMNQLADSRPAIRFRAR